ncbi:hypothetical protein CYMTET_9412 [Cymbomonas tetramitiformis]|uniref:PA domain-containing protein n=1 Tax=Cymbomonas tetramitiformis TaxID=36881 RepID=A0AAE0GSV6_9CHLO|nr:hypothetical protein CYMTET_9412 [Cymbomonas tetramitiformis]
MTVTPMQTLMADLTNGSEANSTGVASADKLPSTLMMDRAGAAYTENANLFDADDYYDSDESQARRLGTYLDPIGELSYLGGCGVPGGTSCYVAPDPAVTTRPGHSSVSGILVLAQSRPLHNNADYFYLEKNALKIAGTYSEWLRGDEDASIGNVNTSDYIGKYASTDSRDDDELGDYDDPITNDMPTAHYDVGTGHPTEIPGLVHQGFANSSANVDLEACTDLINAEEIRGRVCLVVRGTCAFSTKTLHCQKAGAIATVIVDNIPDEDTQHTWAGSYPPHMITIPTITMRYIILIEKCS